MARYHINFSRRLVRGVAAVELALVLPFLLALTFITTELGRAIYHYSVLTHAVGESVRYLSYQTPGQGANVARNLVIYGNTQGTGSPVLPGLDATMVPAPVWETVGAAPPVSMVTITVRGYRFNSLVGNAFGLTLGPIVFGDIAASMRAPQ